MKAYRFAGALVLFLAALGSSFVLGGKSVAQDRGGVPAYAFLEGKKVGILVRPCNVPYNKELEQQPRNIYGTVVGVDQTGVKVKVTSFDFPNGEEVPQDLVAFVPWTGMVFLNIDDGKKPAKKR